MTVPVPSLNNGHSSTAATTRTPGFSTRAIHVGSEPENSISRGVNTPLDLSTTYKQDRVGVHAGFEYSRSANPSRLAFERAIASLEGGDVLLSQALKDEGIDERESEAGPPGVAFSSGSAATATVIQALGGHGGHLVSVGDVYGGTSRYQLKMAGPLQGLETTYVDMSYSTKPDGGKVETEEEQDSVIVDRIEQAIRPETKLIWIETPTNPMLSLVPIALVASVAKKHNLYLVVDNTFASPYLQQPLLLGADIVVASSTKYIGGHSDVVGGLAVTGNPALLSKLRFIQNAGGAVPSPFDAYLLIRSLKTLALRVREHSRNALAVARWLEEKAIPAGLVRDVRYPGLKRAQETPAQKRERYLAWDQLSDEAKRYDGLAREGFTRDSEGGFPAGGMVSFHIRSGSAQSQTETSVAETFLETLRVFTLAESLGGVESLAELPLKMTHGGVDPTHRAKLGIDGELIRLSVGVEDVEDLLHDVETALKAAVKA
ncbi:RHTO0S01e04258g1_1 [Rhodotorula toruloides]|uniref:cystathionine gamma-lyase n=1 Tax=Rhodotorula toruloides TaxID=5286 RepID=A0A061ADQ4_RHOTO|nr:RHTO0S01e04258g1_1 [Rhodotorula toruloides]